MICDFSWHGFAWQRLWRPCGSPSSVVTGRIHFLIVSCVHCGVPCDVPLLLLQAHTDTGLLLPGFSPRSVAYHNDGTVLNYANADDPPLSAVVPRFGSGDVVGCGWDPAASVFLFTLNGAVIWMSNFSERTAAAPQAYFPVRGRGRVCRRCPCVVDWSLRFQWSLCCSAVGGLSTSRGAMHASGTLVNAICRLTVAARLQAFAAGSYVVEAALRVNLGFQGDTFVWQPPASVSLRRPATILRPPLSPIMALPRRLDQGYATSVGGTGNSNSNGSSSTRAAASGAASGARTAGTPPRDSGSVSTRHHRGNSGDVVRAPMCEPCAVAT